MRKKKRDKRISYSMFSVTHYLVFFLLISAMVTCCFLFFFGGLELPEDVIRQSASKTFKLVVALSVLCASVDIIRRKFSIERPVKRILAGLARVKKGDFNTRIEPVNGGKLTNEFDAIIEDLNLMVGELAGIETLRTDFVANVSHELKTPLAVIQNYATMLQTPDLPEEQRVEYAKAVADASRRLSGLITNILKLNKLENQQLYPNAQKYNLSEQICECLLDFESEWEKKDLEIETDIQEDVFIKADSELLSLVWNNLFSNAIKFTEPGGTVTVRVKEDGDTVKCQVEDTGCGISPEVGKHIFEKFYQGDTSHSRQGNGLGLALVQRVVDIARGEISVNSIAGKGSTFTVTFQRGEL